jgi:SAM-dependent methyltransferase
MADVERGDPPSEFVVHWARALADRVPAPRRALDIAMGRGRHVEALVRAGYRLFGVDAKLDAVRSAVSASATHGLVVRGWCADLTEHPLPRDRFELIVVTRYLQRDLFPAISRALVPGGVVLYETFTEGQRALGRGPTSPDHLLGPGELRASFAGLDVLFYEEVTAAEAVARIVGRKASA